MSANGTIDDKVKDPAPDRLDKAFAEFRGIESEVEKVFSSLMGQKADSASGDRAAKLLYEGEKPALAGILSKYGISGDHEKTNALYGILITDLKKAFAESKSGFVDSALIQQIAASIASRYFGRAIEAEPARLTNLAEKKGISKAVDIARGMIETLYGKIAAKGEEVRLKGIKTAEQFRDYAANLYQNSLPRMRDQYAR